MVVMILVTMEIRLAFDKERKVFLAFDKKRKVLQCFATSFQAQLLLKASLMTIRSLKISHFVKAKLMKR